MISIIASKVEWFRLSAYPLSPTETIAGLDVSDGHWIGASCGRLPAADKMPTIQDRSLG